MSAHESELDRMKGFYEDHKEIFKLIDKREEMWVKMLNFEVCLCLWCFIQSPSHAPFGNCAACTQGWDFYYSAFTLAA